jgi:hypothetical protein
MKIIADEMSIRELQQMAAATFGDMVKAVVDVERDIIAVDAELHADLEAALLADGSNQKNLWGINLYPDVQGDDRVEFDSLINMKPSQGNRSRGVDDANIREQILDLVRKSIKP